MFVRPGLNFPVLIVLSGVAIALIYCGFEILSVAATHNLTLDGE